MSRLRAAYFAVWHWSYQTPDALSNAAKRQARLVAGVCLALLLVVLSAGVLLFILLPFNRGPNLTEAIVTLSSAPFLLAALVLNRRGRSNLASGLALLVITLDAWSAALVNTGTHIGGTELLIYPIITIILSGMLLPAWPTALITAANLALLVIFSRLPSQTDPSAAVGPSIFYVGIFVLSALAGSLRQRDLARLDARERALADSEAKYRRMVDLAQEGIWIVDAASRTTFVNQRMCDLLGYSRPELLGADFRMFIDEASRPDMPAAAERHLTGRAGQPGGQPGRPNPPDIQLRRRDGSLLWVIISATPLSDEAGRYTGLLALLTDITQRKRSEAALTESRQRFESAFQYAAVGMALVSPDGRWLQVNAALCAMLGYSEAELLATNFQALTHPDDLAADLRSVAEVTAGREPRLHLEKRYLHKQGQVVSASVSGALVRDAHGEPLYFVAQIQDVTERKQALESLRASAEHDRRLFEEGERLREFNASIIRNMAEGLIVSDAQGIITLVNPKLAGLLGFTQQELVGQSQWMLFAPGALADARQNAAGRPQGLTSAYESALLTKSKSEVPVLISATPILLDGRFNGTLGTVTDITGRKQSEAELQQANAKLTVWLTEAEQRTHDISLLNELGELLQTSQTVEEAYALVPQLMPALFPRSAGRLYVIKASRNLIDPVGQWGPVTGAADPFEPNDCWALRRGHSHVVQPLGLDPQAGPPPAVICNHVKEPRPAAYLCVPMMAQNESLGVLHLQRPVTVVAGEAPLAWSEGQMRLARTVADTVALALASLRLRETLRHQSIRDPLTGLFNRRYLEETLERELHRMRREQRPLGVMMLDIDHFKEFNDALGHEAGDQILRAVSNVLRAHARAEDIVCRYGGEEFILILPDATLAVTLGRAEQICQAVRSLGSDFSHGAAATVTISIGVAGFPEHGDNGADIIRMADATLYQAKRAGRDQVLVAVSAI